MVSSEGFRHGEGFLWSIVLFYIVEVTSVVISMQLGDYRWDR